MKKWERGGEGERLIKTTRCHHARCCYCCCNVPMENELGVGGGGVVNQSEMKDRDGINVKVFNVNLDKQQKQSFACMSDYSLHA